MHGYRVLGLDGAGRGEVFPVASALSAFLRSTGALAPAPNPSSE
jgi:hypothetical protein